MEIYLTEQATAARVVLFVLAAISIVWGGSYCVIESCYDKYPRWPIVLMFAFSLAAMLCPSSGTVRKMFESRNQSADQHHTPRSNEPAEGGDSDE